MPLKKLCTIIIVRCFIMYYYYIYYITLLLHCIMYSFSRFIIDYCYPKYCIVRIYIEVVENCQKRDITDFTNNDLYSYGDMLRPYCVFYSPLTRYCCAYIQTY